jgi:hypothetical protein
MSILTYTTKQWLSIFTGPPRPARAVLPGTGMLMSSSSGPPRPARALAHRDVRLQSRTPIRLSIGFMNLIVTVVSSYYILPLKSIRFRLWDYE